MRYFKRLGDKSYIHRFFRHISTQRNITVSISYKGNKTDAVMVFSHKRGILSVISPDNTLFPKISAGEDIEVSITNYEDMYLFKSTVTYSADNIYDIEMPSILYVSFERQMPRYIVGKEENVTVDFLYENRGFTVEDISIKGLSFAANEPLFEENQIIRNMNIKLPGAKYIRVDAIICNHRVNEDKMHIYGVSFTDIGDDGHVELAKYVNGRLYPYFKPLQGLTREEAYSILDDIDGNINGIRKNNGHDMENRIHTFEKLLEQPDVSTGMAYEKDSRLLNKGLSVRIYNRTFYGYELFPRPEWELNSEAGTNVNINLVNNMLNSTFFEFYISYITKDCGRSCDLLFSICSIIGDKNKFSIDKISGFECECDQVICSSDAGGYFCEQSVDTGSFLKFCDNTLEHLEIGAYGYFNEVFNQSEIRQIYSDLNITIARKLLCIKKGEERIAYAVAETYSDIISIGGIHDVCRIYFVQQNIDTDKMLAALIPELATYYKNAGKTNFNIWFMQRSQAAHNIKIKGIAKEMTICRVMANREGMLEYKKLLLGGIAGNPGYYKLTHPQLSIWYTEKVYPGTNLANITGEVIIKDEVDFKLLERAINLIIMENDGFRLRIVEIDNQPWQYVSEYKHVGIDFYDFCAKKYEEFKDWSKRICEKNFSILNSDLFSFAFFKLNNNEGGFYIKTHHLISDAWTMSIVVNKTLEYYVKLKNGINVRRVYKPSYLDFIRSEEEYAESNRFELQKQFWESKFESIPELISLKAANSVLRDTIAQRKTFKVSKKLTSAINIFSSETKNSVFSIFLSVFTMYINRISLKEDMVIGVPVLNRSNAREKETAGMFINVVPLRLNINSDIEFSKHVANISKEWMLVLKNQKYPCDLIQKYFRDKHKVNDKIYDMVLSFQNAEYNKSGIDYDSEWKSNGNQVNSLNIHINDRENEGQYKIDFDYLVSVFSVEEIECMYNHMINLLTDAIENPSKKLYQLGMLSETEKNRLLYEFNQTKADYPKDKTIHELFEEQVEKTPDNVAVVYGDMYLSYRELNERSHQLARVLRYKGVKPGVIVGIVVERSIEMVIGIMGILKAGGAYLPISPSYPEDRVQYIVDDSCISMILTCDNLFVNSRFKGVVIDLKENELYSIEGGNLERVSSAKDLAYIIYTSGSTGKPKGVMIKHQSVVNLLVSLQNEYPLLESDAFLQKTTYTFDVSVAELFGWYMNGGRLVLLKEGAEKDPKAILEAIDRYNITHLNFVPSMFRAFLCMIKKEDVSIINKLKYIFLAGEAVSHDVLAMFYGFSRSVRLENLYGPTEATVYATGYNLNKLSSWNTVPIGRPFKNYRIYILNKYNVLQPVGVAGELCIAGDGLASGYKNNDELTQERFIQNPYADGERIYKTGDLARWLPDGDLEFVGRIDGQVKIRGFRIELGEIENKLSLHQDIKETVVIAREDEENRYLCAYYVSDKVIPVSDLCAFLLQGLPDYMVPAYFVKLDKLPVTANGKLDRKALPEPDKSSSIVSTYKVPVNEVEEKLCMICEEVLGIRRIGMADNFFELGGDSLKVIALVSKVHKEFGVEMPVGIVFQKPELGELARFITDNNIKPLSSIKKVKSHEYHPVSSSQKRMYIMNRSNADSINYNMPGAILIEGAVDIVRLKHAFDLLIERHESFRTSFYLIDGEILQKVHNRVDFDLRTINSEEMGINSEADLFVRPFDLSKAPLLRAELLIVSEKMHYLFVDMHHIISDGVSNSIVIKEIADLYQEKSLPELKYQYKDYVLWQRELLSSDRIKKQETYWLKTLSGELPILNMPLDYSRPPVQLYEGDRIKFELNPELTGCLKQLAANSGTTLYIVLLAAYNVLLHRYTGQEDIIVGLPVAGRTHSDLENIVGMFVNTLTVRSYPTGEKTFMSFLHEVGQNAISAYENQDYQFDYLMEKLAIRRDLSRNPLFDTMFALQNLGISEAKAGNLTFSSYEIDCKISKFDFSLQAVEKGDKVYFDLDYCTGLFKRETMERFKEHFINLLNSVSNNPDYEISKLEILSIEEKHKLVYGFNHTEAEYPKDKTICQLFEEQVEKAPDSIAVFYGNGNMTYGELNKRSNQLARVLMDRGVGTGSIVAIMVERSLEMVVGIMGILKSGGTYLPIDPEYAKERIDYILEDSNAAILLTRKEYSDSLDYKGDIVDLSAAYINEKNTDNIDRLNDPESMVYIIYTSGSTGKPKGVNVCNRSLVNLCWWYKGKFHINNNSNVLMMIPFCFDASVKNILTPLITGGKLILAPSGRYEAAALLNLISDNRVTIINCVPSAIYPMIEMAGKNGYKELSSLRYLLLGGETMNISRIKPWLESENCSCILGNIYGPTECTDISTCYIVDKEEIYKHEKIPIGRPIYNSKLYVLGKYGQLLPVGVTGELCISGVGVSKGYLNRDDLTSEKFIRNPFIDGERIYKTGDYARWLPEGDLEFLGRIDGQVKLRGFRVELGEIENILSSHEEVQEAVVTARDGKDCNKYLCAYYVSSEHISTSKLRSFLMKKLPNYMIPAFFIRVDKLKLTSNGKIDRKSLPEPDESTNIADNYEAPANEVEEKLCMIWGEVLGVKRISTKNNFFELGGDSLSVLKVLAGIYQYGWNLEMQDFYESKTLKELADKVRNERAYLTNQDKDIKIDVGEIDLKYQEREPEIFTNSYITRKTLLTGATGFLGIHILSELLKDQEANVYCLIRGESVQHAEDKLRRMLMFYFGNRYDSMFDKRIFVVTGDISIRGLGLSEKKYHELGRQVDVVIHAAALVKHYGVYSDFETINVEGTKNIVEFCDKYKKRLCHISTTSIAGTAPVEREDGVCYTENDFYVGQDYSKNVYIKSKFIAEKVVLDATRTGLSATILRVGNLTGRYSDGKFQINIKENNFYNILKYIFDVGVISNDLLERCLEFAPVDCCCEAIVKLCSTEGSYGRVFHLLNHNYFQIRQLRTFCRTMGKEIKVLDNNSFMQYFQEMASSRDTRDKLLSMVNELNSEFKCGNSKTIIVKSEKTVSFLKELGFKWPKIENDYINKIISYAASIGFISD